MVYSSKVTHLLNTENTFNKILIVIVDDEFVCYLRAHPLMAIPLLEIQIPKDYFLIIISSKH